MPECRAAPATTTRGSPVRQGTHRIDIADSRVGRTADQPVPVDGHNGHGALAAGRRVMSAAADLRPAADCQLLLVQSLDLRDVAFVERLSAQPAIEVAAVAHDVSSTHLQALRVRPDVVVVAFHLGEDVPRIVACLAALPQPPAVLVVQGPESDDALLASIEAGADGFLLDSDGPERIAHAARALRRGESVVPPTMLAPLLRRLIDRRRETSRVTERLVELTRREREVLGLLVDGDDAATIATRLVISPETVRTHIQRILRKLDVHSRVEAVALVSRSGLARQLSRPVEVRR
jgi:DNA-binding NarL/FixJ family response regulator